MKILKPNTEDELVCILKQHLYVKVTDFDQKCFLKEIIVGSAQHSWEWVDVKTSRPIDISGIDNKYCTFEHAINRAVNDPYCTVYEFENFDKLAEGWLAIKYVDNIKTVYKEEDQIEWEGK